MFCTFIWIFSVCMFAIGLYGMLSNLNPAIEPPATDHIMTAIRDLYAANQVLEARVFDLTDRLSALEGPIPYTTTRKGRK